MSQPGWVCPACRQLAMGPGDCPKCLQFRRYVKVVPLGRGGALRMAQVRLDDLTRVVPKLFPGITEVMNGGFVAGSVTLVWGGPGIGKSRLMLQLADGIEGSGGSALYVATEQPPEHVKGLAALVGVGESPFYVSHQRDPQALHHLIRETAPVFVVVDSLQGMVDEPGPSSLVRTTKRLIQTAREFACAMVLVFHETKAGDYAGPRTVEHEVDGMVTLEREGGGIVWEVNGKYRFGPSSRYARLRENGGRFHDRDEVAYRGARLDGAEDRGGTLDREATGSPASEPTP